MTDQLGELIDSLLYEGYALYPYTPGAIKNATPTPFGIVYPPAYAAASASTFDHLDLRCVLRAPLTSTVRAQVSFLVTEGERHEASARRLSLGPAALADLVRSPAQLIASVACGDADPLTVGMRLSAYQQGSGAVELSLRVDNLSPCPAGCERPFALRRSLLSTHPVLQADNGRFVSPLDCDFTSFNTYPVLATDADDAVLGAAIVLPDHPRIAPESRGGLFDSTEIEEALLLHVRTLSDGERAEIERHDPAVAAMVRRAAAATPDEIRALHGRVTLSDPPSRPALTTELPRPALTTEPPREPPWLVDPSAGEQSASVAGVTLRRGARVRIRPGPDADLHARLLDGRTATVERIFTDYDGRTHLGVTIDGDPGQELMRETSRLLFFFANEVEVVGA